MVPTFWVLIVVAGLCYILDYRIDKWCGRIIIIILPNNISGLFHKDFLPFQSSPGSITRFCPTKAEPIKYTKLGTIQKGNV